MLCCSSNTSRSQTLLLMSEQQTIIEAITEVLLSKLKSIEFERKIVAEMESNEYETSICGLCGRPFPFRHEKRCSFCTKHHCQSAAVSIKKDAELVALVEKYLASDHLKKQAEKLAEEELQKIKKLIESRSKDDLEEEKELDIDVTLNELNTAYAKIRAEKDATEREKGPDFFKGWSSDDYSGYNNKYNAQYDALDEPFHLKIENEKKRLTDKLAQEVKQMTEVDGYEIEYNDGMVMLDVTLTNGEEYSFYWEAKNQLVDTGFSDGKNKNTWSYGWQEFFETAAQLNQLEYDSTYKRPFRW
jgi:hypothetical protein